MEKTNVARNWRANEFQLTMSVDIESSVSVSGLIVGEIKTFVKGVKTNK